MEQKKRTKEELIAAQRAALKAQATGTDVTDEATAPAMRGDAAVAIEALARQAGRAWEITVLAGFDLRLVDEQGRLYGAAGTGQPGEHLDDILARGVARVSEMARRSLHASPESSDAPRAGGTTETQTITLDLPEGSWVILVSGGRLPKHALQAIEEAAEKNRNGGGPARIVLEAPPGVSMEVKSLVRKTPGTRDEFLSALGLEEGVAHPGLREKIAEWMALPLTEERAKLEEEAHQRIVTQRCRSCREPACAGCGARAESTQFGPTMLTLPGHDGRLAEVPICKGCLQGIDVSTSILCGGRIVSKEANRKGHHHKVLVLEPAPGGPRGSLVLKLPSGRKVVLRQGLRSLTEAIIREVEARRISLAVIDGLAAELEAVFDEVAPFTAADLAELEAVFEEYRRRSADQQGTEHDRALRAAGYDPHPVTANPSVNYEPSWNLTPSITTFADLSAAGKPATVIVLEPDRYRAQQLLEHLFAIGGAHMSGPRVATDHISFGAVTVYVTMDPERVMGCRCDVAVGFDERMVSHLTDGSSIRMSVAAADAPRFWGLA